ncbi:MAG: hypothetical protein GY761_11625 [Hyphomicrobiales bacterium]|nr:hypothetical protein [Hyphomicrobiales bacterium]
MFEFGVYAKCIASGVAVEINAEKGAIISGFATVSVDLADDMWSAWSVS